MDVDTEVRYEYDNSFFPNDGRVVIKNWSMYAEKIEIVINNNRFFYDIKSHTFTPDCNCNLHPDSQCICTHLPVPPLEFI